MVGEDWLWARYLGHLILVSLRPVLGVLEICSNLLYSSLSYKMAIIPQTIITLPQNQLKFVGQSSSEVPRVVTESHKHNIPNNDSKGVER